MPRVTTYLRDDVPYVAFKCPGCEWTHDLPTAPNNTGHKWGYNGNAERPTLTPSILMTSEWTDYGKATEEDWGPWTPHPTMPEVRQRELKPEAKAKAIEHKDVCHSFVTDGRIQFLGDCTHKLAGQTIDLPEIVA